MNEEERQAIIHLLDKQARYEYCINNNISFSDEDYEAYIIRQSMINKDKEIERLNNIIKQYDKVSFIHEMELQKRIDKAIELVKQRIKEIKNEELSYVEMTSKDYIVEQEELLQILNKGE